MASNFSELWLKAPEGSVTTGIGSLPHVSVDSALQSAFRMGVPFLPQVPIKNPLEYMIPQAIDGLPGLSSPGKGEVALTFDQWKDNFKKLQDDLEKAFQKVKTKKAFEAFQPSDDFYNCWRPFLWEIADKKMPFVKIQLAGPLTSQWALRLTDGTPADRFPEIGMQIFRLVLARSIAMVRAVKEAGAVPLFFVDEPGFYCYNKLSPRHLMGLQELKIFVQSIQKEQALVGLHCCSNTDWKTILSTGVDVLSIDTQLSLNLLLKNRDEVKTFLQEGGRLSFGVIPTARGASDLETFDLDLAFEKFQTDWLDNGFQPSELKSVLKKCFITPACGLALHRIEDTEIILGYQHEFADKCNQYASA